MSLKPIEQAKTPELALALPALRSARKRAEEIAIATDTALIQGDDGQVVPSHVFSGVHEPQSRALSLQQSPYPAQAASQKQPASD